MKQPKISRSHSTQILSDQKPLSLESPPQIKMAQTMKEQVEKSKYKSNEMDLFIGCALILFSFFLLLIRAILMRNFKNYYAQNRQQSIRLD